MMKFFVGALALAFAASVPLSEAVAQPKKTTVLKKTAAKKAPVKKAANKKVAAKKAASKKAAKKKLVRKTPIRSVPASATPPRQVFPKASFQEVQASFQQYKDAGGYSDLIQAGTCVRERVLVSQRTKVLTFTSSECLERGNVLIGSQLKPHGVPVVDFGEAKALLDAERAGLPPKPVEVADMPGSAAVEGFQSHEEPSNH